MRHSPAHMGREPVALANCAFNGEMQRDGGGYIVALRNVERAAMQLHHLARERQREALATGDAAIL